MLKDVTEFSFEIETEPVRQGGKTDYKGGVRFGSQSKIVNQVQNPVNQTALHPTITESSKACLSNMRIF